MPFNPDYDIDQTTGTYCVNCAEMRAEVFGSETRKHICEKCGTPTRPEDWVYCDRCEKYSEIDQDKRREKCQCDWCGEYIGIDSQDLFMLRWFWDRCPMRSHELAAKVKKPNNIIEDNWEYITQGWSLSAKRRDLVLKMYKMSLPNEDIAEHLQLSVRSVEGIIQRARNEQDHEADGEGDEGGRI